MNFKSKTYFLFITLIVFAALTLTSCNPAITEETATEASPTKEDATEILEIKDNPQEALVFGVVPKITHPFYDDVLAGLEEATAGLEGVEFQWIAPPTGNPAEQVQILEDLINMGVDGIGIAPLEAASVESVIKQAKAAGIPVVTFDSDAPDSARVAYYGTDNRAAGRQQAEVMAEALGGKGQVALVTGSLVMANLNERIEGVKEVLAEKYPDLELVDTIATDDDFAKGLDVCEAMLRAYPDLDGVIAVSMTGSVAMPKVLADPAFADRGDLIVVGFDDFEDTLKGIRDGYILATMVQRPKQMGIYVIEGLTTLNMDGPAESIDTGITVVTMDNIDSYKSGSSAEEKPLEELVFGVVPKITHPFYDDVLAGLEEATAGLEGVEFQWIAPPTGNPAEQVQILEDLINMGVDGIGIAPLEAASVESVIKQAKAAGIPVVTFDSDAPDSARVAYYGTDNRAAGRQQAEVMAEALGGKGQVALVTGSLVMANLNERIEGVKEVLAEKYPDLELVDTIATDDDFAKGLDVCEAMLRAYPDLDGVIAVSMTGSVAMPKVLADPAFADRGDLIVVGFDDFEDTLKGIRDGYILATMVQRPKQMGIYVIEGLTSLNMDGPAESVDTGITVVTMDNIDSYK
jgi:ribose transport system substrate-binding protein